MQKRGQVSVFAIVGVVLVILVALFFFLRNEYGFFVSPTSFLGEKAKPIEDNLRDCVKQTVDDSLNNFAKQGGDFNPSNSKLYQSLSVKYFCNNIPGEEKCLNVMPALGQIVSGFNAHVQEQVAGCLDEGLVEGGLGYEVNAGRLSTNTVASGNNLLITVDYDVNITKGEIKTSVRPVTVRYDAPLEELYSVSVDVVNSEASIGFFEQLVYMLARRGQYIIEVDKPYPDKVYKIHKKDSNFEFWFAVEGERNNV